MVMVGDFSTVIVAIFGIISFLIIQQLSSGSKVEATKSDRLAKPRPLGQFTVDEVAKHCVETDCWIIVDSKVYDITTYIEQHPGGETILKNAGGDASKGVHGPQHPITMWTILADYHIGDIKI